MPESRAELETSRARHAHENGSNRRAFKHWYDKNRLLENAIRRQAAKCFTAKDEDEAQAAMADLLRLVPKNPRKKWGLR